MYIFLTAHNATANPRTHTVVLSAHCSVDRTIERYLPLCES